MASIPSPIKKWVKEYVSGEGSGEVSDVVVEKVETRSGIPDRDGVFYVEGEDAIVLRVDD